MLNSLKQTGKSIGHEASRVLPSRRSDALAHIDKAQASLKNDVLTVRLPKEGGGGVKSTWAF